MSKTKILTTVLALVISGTIAFAQNKTYSEKKQSDSTKITPVAAELQNDSVYYACPMHPDVTMDKPGRCSKCGMKLEKKTIKMTEPKSEKMEVIKTYICSMHPDIKSDKPGRCPKCGMVLTEEIIKY